MWTISAGAAASSSWRGCGARFKMAFGDDACGRARKRSSAREHLVQRCAERENVDSRVQWFAAYLFGDMYRQGPSVCPGDADRRTRSASCRSRRDGRCFTGALVGGGELGQAEVEDLRVAAFSDEDVGGLDVAVDDALRVRRADRLGNLDRQGKHRLGLQAFRREQCGEGLPFERLHDDEIPAIVLVDVVDGADMRMVESGGGSRLAPESLERNRIARDFLRQKLESNGTAEACVFCLVDYSHPAAAKFGHDAVPGNHAAIHPMCGGIHQNRGSACVQPGSTPSRIFGPRRRTRAMTSYFEQAHAADIRMRRWRTKSCRSVESRSMPLT